MLLLRETDKGNNMQITYWYSQNSTGNDAHSVRQPTKKAAVAELASREPAPGEYGPLVKVVVEYQSGFDLLSYALSEGGVGEEAAATLDAEA